MNGLGGLNKSPNGVGRYRLPWESEVKITDGTSCGLPAPSRRYGETQTAAAAE